MKIKHLTGDGPESEDELSMYEYKVKTKILKNVHPKNIYITTEPINPAKNFDAWMNHIHSLSQSLSREWRTHYNH